MRILDKFYLAVHCTHCPRCFDDDFKNLFLAALGLFFFKNYLFTLGCAGSSLLHRLSSSCDEWGLLIAVVHRLLTAVASLVRHRLQ